MLWFTINTAETQLTGLIQSEPSTWVSDVSKAKCHAVNTDLILINVPCTHLFVITYKSDSEIM